MKNRYDSFSSSGVVKKGHIDIDSEDEADEQLGLFLYFDFLN